MKKVILNDYSLKIEYVNAVAMTQGFSAAGKKFYSTIFTASKFAWSLKNDFKNFPKLLTLLVQKQQGYAESYAGHIASLEGNDFMYKYIAYIDSIYHINNTMELWERICSNGLFDIWQPTAPFNSLFGQKNIKPKQDPMILLLRIYEIDKDFTCEINKAKKNSTYYHDVPEKTANIVKPIITNKEFKKIKEKLASSIEDKFLRFSEQVNDTISFKI